uniref:NR LBD domain-containing protein n=1 Tax=Meloidogyne enterolobii TaxID=390850 RepID=A0A6V7WLA2_MELEN|nr:unnamed protein product [Meloidogyne enterolobii]
MYRRPNVLRAQRTAAQRTANQSMNISCSNNNYNKNICYIDGEIPVSLFINKDNLIIDFLISVERNAQRVRNSITRAPVWHHNNPYNSIETLINQKQNLIANSNEYLHQQQILSLKTIEFINKNGFFKTRPLALILDFLLIMDIGKTMPFFNDLDLSDKICLITQITLPLSILLSAYYSYTKKYNTVILPSGLSMAFGFSGEYYKGDETIAKLSKKVFTDSMEPFNRVQLTEEEYVLLRAIIFCHSFTDGLSKQGRELLLNESEKYSKILMKILQNRHGEIPGARRYAECVHLAEICLYYGYQNSLFLNYLANVYERDHFQNAMPEAFVNICLRNKIK